MRNYSVARGAPRAVAVPCRAYWRLCKPKVVLLVTFTAVVGMFLSTAGAPPLGAFVFGTLGIALAAASSAFTRFLQRSSAEINRLCPLKPAERPVGCPKREQPGGYCE